MSKRNSRKNRASKPSLVEQLEQRRLMATINVSDFGARPNDGVDDTNAIRSAINASNNGDTIVFAGGQFNVRDNIELKSHRTYTGGGSLRRNPGEGFIFSTDGANTNIKIDNLTLDGGGLNAGNGMAKGMVVVNSTIKNITKGWPNGQGIALPAGAEHSKFSHNKFINIMGENGVYGFNRFHEVEFSNNYFDTVFEGIHLAYENGGNNLRIINNTFIRTTRMAVELQGRKGTNTLLEGNKASEWINNYHGSFFFSITNLTDGVIVRNNHASSGKFGQIDPKAKDTPVGIEVSGRNVLVEGNVIENFREGLHTMNIRDAVFRNNKFYNQTWMAVWRTGINVDDLRGQNLSYVNNEIYNPKVTAFLFHGSTTGTIAGNKVYLFGGAQEYTEGNGGAYNGVNRPGNNVQRMSGNPQPYTGQAPSGGSNNGGGGNIEWPPSTPSGLQATAKSPTQIDIAWGDNADDEKGFKLYRRDNAGGDWELIANLGANVKTYKDGGVQANKDYSYKVLAWNDNGNSGFSNEHNATTPKTVNDGGSGNNGGGGVVNPNPVVVAPAAPVGLGVVAKSKTQIDVTFQDKSDNETGFKLYRRDNGNGDWELIATLGANVTTYKDGGVQAGRNYSYKVLAYNGAGASGWSNEHNAITPSDPVQPTPTAPAAPSGVQVQAKNGKRVDVSWVDNSADETGFKLYRRDNRGRDDGWELIATLAADATSYVDNDAAAGMHYSYKLVAINAAGASGWSNEHDAKTEVSNQEPTPIEGPAAPSGLKARTINRQVVETKWQGLGQGVKGVKVYRREGDGHWVFIAQMDGAATSFKDGSVESGKTYTYRVRAFDVLHSNFSNEDTTSTMPAEDGDKPHVGNGNGLTATYYNNADFTSPVTTRSEAVDFDWGTASPADGVDADTFSVRWTGQIMAQYDEQYSFYVTSDDGVRLWVDGKLIVDSWQAQAAKTSIGKIKLEAGKVYDIKLEYFEQTGDASCVLGWASRSQGYQVVPKTQLLSASAVIAV